MSTVELPYGRETLTVRLPAGARATIIEKPQMPVIAEPVAAVEAALDHPTASDPVPELAAGCRTACIVVCDITRPVPNALFLPALIDRLLRGGITPDGLTILVATGLHRPNEGAELDELLGTNPRVRDLRVLNHHALIEDEHVHVGDTVSGTPVKLDRRFLAADLRIVTGLVEPHLMAGWSGGRKVVAPGLAHADTIATLHSHRFMAHPKATNCVLEGNPLHTELEEIARLVGDVVALNTVIDDQRRLAFVNFGDVLESHLEAVDFAARYSRVVLDRRFSTVLTSAGGHPLDATYYQTVKGMVGPLGLVAEDGDVIVASACSEGLGSPDFAAAQARLANLGQTGFLRTIAAQNRAEIDEWQTQMQVRAQTQARVSLFTQGLDDESLRLTGTNPVDSVEAAVAASIDRHGDAEIAVVPHGPYVVPVAEDPAQGLETGAEPG